MVGCKASNENPSNQMQISPMQRSQRSPSNYEVSVYGLQGQKRSAVKHGCSWHSRAKCRRQEGNESLPQMRCMIATNSSSTSFNRFNADQYGILGARSARSCQCQSLLTHLTLLSRHWRIGLQMASCQWLEPQARAKLNPYF